MSKTQIWIDRVFSNVPANYDLCAGGCADTDDNGIGCGDCEACSNEDEFSSYRCELCGALPGARHDVVAIRVGDFAYGDDSDVLHYAACTDCLLFVANGDLPEHLDSDEER